MNLKMTALLTYIMRCCLKERNFPIVIEWQSDRKFFSKLGNIRYIAVIYYAEKLVTVKSFPCNGLKKSFSHSTRISNFLPTLLSLILSLNLFSNTRFFVDSFYRGC